MAETDRSPVALERALVALVGGAAGLSLWMLAEKLPDITDNETLILLLVTLTGGFFAVLLGGWGPLSPAKAVTIAAALALVASLLLSWASLRYDNLSDFLDTGHPLVAYGLLISIPVPFLIAALTPGEGWRNYPALFNHAWQVVVRYLVAWAFTGLFWLVILLSDQVLKIVGLEVIEQLLEIAPVPFVLTGLMLGLGMAVVHELRAYISPFLALQMLRLLLPLVLLVSVVFLIAAPIQGLSELFGGVSSAAILMALALAAAVLITTTLDASDDEAAGSPILRHATRAMALILPLLAGLAAWAVWLRVMQYGWTPTRVAATLSAGVVLAYGLSYAAAVLRGHGWAARVRQANIAMALALVALAGLWLSPVLNAERLSVNSQMTRFEGGRSSADSLDLWAIGREWGRAGQAAMARLKHLDHPERARLDQRLALLGRTESRWQWRNGEGGGGTEAAGRRQDVLDVLAIRPVGARFPDQLEISGYHADIWLQGCGLKTPAGNPGCVAVLGNFDAQQSGDEIAVLFMTNEARMSFVALGQDAEHLETWDTGGHWADPAQIDKILEGGFSVARTPRGVLLIGESILSIR